MKLLKLIPVSEWLNFLTYFLCSVCLFLQGAIETCPRESTEELAQFYQNRAAAWESLVYMKFCFYF